MHDSCNMIHESYDFADLVGSMGPPPTESSLAWAEGKLRAEGMRASGFRAPVEVALDALRQDGPLLVLDSAGVPLGLLEARGTRVRVAESGRTVWLTHEELRSRLAVTPMQDAEWLAVDLGAERGRPDKAKGTSPPSSPWRRAWELVAADRADLAVIVVYAIGVGILSLALPLAVQVLVNTVAFGALVQPIVVVALLLAAGLTFGATLRALQAWVVEIVQRRFFVRVVAQLSERLPRVHASAFERAHGPELVNRFFDVFTAQKAIAALMLGGVEATLTVVVGLMVVAFYHPLLLGLGLAIVAGILAVALLLGRGATPSSCRESKAKYAVAGWLEEMARHLFALKRPGGARAARARLDVLAGEWLDARASHFRIVFRQVVGVLALQVLCSVALLGIGGLLVVQRELTIGQLVASELILTAVVAALSKLGGKLETAYDLVAAAEKLDVILSLPAERADGEGLSTARASSLVVRDLPVGTTTVNFSLVRGVRAVLKGTAAAQRELVDVLFGLREPRGGSVLLDGQDIRVLRREELRRHVAVLRDVELWPGTVHENLGHAPSHRLWSCLEKVGLATVVRGLEAGLHTRLDARGGPLSRGQALRLMLARALVEGATVIVLEAPELGALLAEGAFEPVLEDAIVIASMDGDGMFVVEVGS